MSQDQPANASTRVLQILTVLGTANAMWAIFLWRELLRARSGEKPFCGFGESTDCASLWSADFANTVHAASGLPVAAWGLVWGLVALALPIAALMSLRQAERLGPCLSAIRATAGAGMAGVALLLAVSSSEGLFCTSCAATYLITLIYTIVAFLGLNQAPRGSATSGLLVAGSATVAAYLLLLYPGLKTPKSLESEGQRALAEAGRQADGAPPAQATTSQGLSAGEANAKLQEFLANLQEQALQGVADSLYLYGKGTSRPPRSPRVIAKGPAEAPVRITEFHDTLCGHCATLHETMEYIATLVPSSSFQLVARHFPLDGHCNPHLQKRGEETVRCMAARAQICMEDSGKAHAFAGELFKRQQELTNELVFDIAEPFMPRAELRACIADSETERRLEEDIAYAWEYEPTGTPLVLINGRQGTQFGPFLYAMILARGNPDHPAFANLPDPSPGIDEPHDHSGHDHSGHDHSGHDHG